MPMRRSLAVAVAICALLTAGSADASVMETIQSHTAKGKTVFVLLTDSSAKDIETARRVAKTAQQRVPNSELVELNRGDAANRAAVAHYRVAGAQVPLVLVVASNGLAVGAARPGATGAVERLVSLVPTPAKAEYLRILNDKQVAMVVFSRRTMKEQGPLFEQITALSRMKDLKRPGTVLVDLDDKAEKSWIAQWKIDPAKLKQPVIIFVNPKGQVLEQLTGVPTAAKMLETASQKASCKCGSPNCKCGSKG